MIDRAAFLRAICENPFDLSARLIYADWLEERGEARAELIRMQIELATIEDRGYCNGPVCVLNRHCAVLDPDCTWHGLHAREKALCVQLQKDDSFAYLNDLLPGGWVLETVPIGTLGIVIEAGTVCRLRGGFIEEILCSVATFSTFAVDLFAWEPILSVQLVDDPYQTHCIVESGHALVVRGRQRAGLPPLASLSHSW